MHGRYGDGQRHPRQTPTRADIDHPRRLGRGDVRQQRQAVEDVLDPRPVWIGDLGEVEAGIGFKQYGQIRTQPLEIAAVRGLRFPKCPAFGL